MRRIILGLDMKNGFLERIYIFVSFVFLEKPDFYLSSTYLNHE